MVLCVLCLFFFVGSMTVFCKYGLCMYIEIVYMLCVYRKIFKKKKKIKGKHLDRIYQQRPISTTKVTYI